ncbi:MAG: WbqC family protein [Cryomorphaceae bacterium]
MALFPIVYAGNLSYYRSLIQNDEVVFEAHEHFPKQTYRNRMEVLGPNGLQKLVIPTVKTGSRRTMNTVNISYSENWQKDHWKSLEAAYRRSPYFEFYEDNFQPFYIEKIESLMEFNLSLHQTICSLLSIEVDHRMTSNYEQKVAVDLRHFSFQEAFPPVPYLQVFSDRHPFTPNLSILDALFNLGPQTLSLLRQNT